MNPHTDGRTEGAAHRPLSALQIRKLICLAREAFLHGIESGSLSETAEFDSWRHDQVMRVVERGGFRECRNEDYLPLKAHFLRLLDRTAEAEEALAKYDTETRSWALNRLQHACKLAADVLPDAMNYASGFIRNHRGVGIDDASDKDLWAAMYTVKRRAEQLRRKAAA
jgi:hypothetical protein